MAEIGLAISSKLACGLAARVLTEMMVSNDRKCSGLISLVEYAYTALLTSYVLMQPRRLPWSMHAKLLLCGVGASYLSNVAIGSALPVFIRHTLKNGQLCCNMLVSSVMLRRRYHAQQILAIGAVTLGILLATAGDASAAGDASSRPPGSSDYGLGALCMAAAMMLRAMRGALQERGFAAHGICAAEVIFAQHLLGLPVFASDLPGLRASFGLWRSLGSVTLPGLDAVARRLGYGGLEVPTMWLLLAAEVCADHLHKLATTRLVGLASALTSTLVSTTQRFIIIAAAGFFFSPTPPPPSAWAGVVLVGGGCVSYALCKEPRGEEAEARRRSPRLARRAAGKDD